MWSMGRAVRIRTSRSVIASAPMSENYVGQDLEALADIPNYQDWILSHFRPHLRGRVLEALSSAGVR
jgi:hypothetical protein